MGRRKWSNRLTVEDCLAFDIVRLNRAGVFQTPGNPWCTYSWDMPDGAVSKIAFRVLGAGTPLGVYCYHRAELDGMTKEIRQTVGLVTRPCNFGGHRFWFVCPMARPGHCAGRAARLYVSPWDARLACRGCLNLTYRSCQEHDSRVDAMLKLPPEDLSRLLRSRNHKKSLLAVTAHQKMVRKLIKKGKMPSTWIDPPLANLGI